MTARRAAWFGFVASAMFLVLDAPLFAGPPGAKPDPFREEVRARVDAVKPLPLTPIPDDPPPHEGAMVSLPYVVEPPDILLIEVLEALPGMPISGERLVRPDGKVSLGFYGELDVKGLTIPQVKVKVVEALRYYLVDSVLGLYEVEAVEEGLPKEAPSPHEQPNGPQEKGGAVGGKKAVKPSSFRVPFSSGPFPTKPYFRRSSSGPARPKTEGGKKPIPPAAPSPEPLAGPEGQTTAIAVPPGGNVKIFIEVTGGKGEPERGVPGVPPTAMESDAEPPLKIRKVAPADSNRVFVDVTTYNSKIYYVQGDVANPGRLAWTGKETVLDALNYAGGLLPTSDPKRISLVRPARGGKAAKVYPIDLQAVTEKGDSRANYQVFPGDRIVVGRNALIQQTVEIDRRAASYQTLVNSMLTASFMTRSLVMATPDLRTAQRQALIKDWFDLWWKAASQPGSVPDETAFRDLLLRLLKAPTPPDGKK